MENINSAPREMKRTALTLLPLAGIILILSGGIGIQMAFFYESLKYNSLSYSLIALITLLVGLYCTFAYRSISEKNAEKNLDANPVFLVILAALSTLLGIVSISMGAFFSEIEMYNPGFFLCIGLFAIIIGLYCVLAFRKLNRKKGNRDSSGGLIFLGILGILGTFLGVINLLGDVRSLHTTFGLIGIWSVVIIEFVAAIVLIFIGTKFFNKYIRKKNSA